MKIQKIAWRNFRSYGNNWSELKLDDTGGLILLTGQNGSGKSTCSEIIEYTVFNKVKGKTKETTPNTDLPNEINGDLETEITYELKSDEITINRTLKDVKVFVNGNELDRANKTNRNQYIETELGFDFKAYKTFVSINVNYFKDFLNMNAEDRRIVRDRLLNLEQIALLQKIGKKMRTEALTDMKKIESSLKSLEFSLEKFQDSINKSKQKAEKQVEKNKEELNNRLKILKTSWEDIFNKITKGQNLLNEIDNSILLRNKVINTLDARIDEYTQRMEIYSKEKCSTCGSVIAEDLKKQLIDDTSKLLETSNSELNSEKKEIFELKEKRKTIYNKIEKLKSSGEEIKAEAKSIKDSITKSDTTIVDDNLDDIRKAINELTHKMESEETIYSDVKLTVDALNIVLEMFGDEGINKLLTERIIKPINIHLKEYCKLLEVPADISFTPDFNAEILRRGCNISGEKMSDGQMRRANLAVLLSYLKIVLTQSPVNILFLDEVFTSIDIVGIKSLIRILDKFAEEHNINIFVVHHAELETNLFKRVLKTEINVFSTLYDITGGNPVECVREKVLTIT